MRLSRQKCFLTFLLVTLLVVLNNCNLRKESKSDSIPDNLVIAHRGTTFYAPEETEAAMRWARNTGADYLELDLQRTKDGYLIALHDETLIRTTNVLERFPERKNHPVSSFTYRELLSLDAGSWFNQTHPERARARYAGQDILTLEDIIRIAEGKRIKRTKEGKRILRRNPEGRWSSEYEDDPADNGNRPGIYIETKVPDLFPGIEQDLEKELTRLGWYHKDPRLLKQILVNVGKVSTGNTKHRVILQTFSKESLIKLNSTFHDYVPICFLLWRGEGPDDLPDDTPETYERWLEFARNNGASIIGPSIGGPPNDYTDLLLPHHSKLILNKGFLIHPYSFDTWEQMDKYYHLIPTDPSLNINGMFTNKANEALLFIHRNERENPDENSNTANDILTELGY